MVERTKRERDYVFGHLFGTKYSRMDQVKFVDDSL